MLVVFVNRLNDRLIEPARTRDKRVFIDNCDGSIVTIFASMLTLSLLLIRTLHHDNAKSGVAAELQRKKIKRKSADQTNESIKKAKKKTQEARSIIRLVRDSKLAPILTYSCVTFTAGERGDKDIHMCWDICPSKFPLLAIGPSKHRSLNRKPKKNPVKFP